jgi:hypothetical protein
LSANNLSWFTQAAKWASRAAGRPWRFIAADEELGAIRGDYLKLARRARTRVKRDKDSVAIDVVRIGMGNLKQSRKSQEASDGFCKS